MEYNELILDMLNRIVKLEKEVEKHIIASDIPIFVYDKEIE